MTSKHKKRLSLSFSKKKKKKCINVMLKYYCLSVRLAKRVMIPGGGENLRREHTHIYWRECELLLGITAFWES